MTFALLGIDGRRFMPVATEAGSSDVEDDSQEAPAQLEALAERQRSRSPDLTKEQAFARVFRDNRELAARAHRRPGCDDALSVPALGGAYKPGALMSSVMSKRLTPLSLNGFGALSIVPVPVAFA